MKPKLRDAAWDILAAGGGILVDAKNLSDNEILDLVEKFNDTEKRGDVILMNITQNLYYFKDGKVDEDKLKRLVEMAYGKVIFDLSDLC